MVSDEAEDTAKVIADSLQAVINYTKFHFKFEEEYMRKINYPGLADHSKLHEDFIARICKYDNDMRNGDLILGTRIIKIIQDWLTEHILIEDKKYATFASREKH